jgi:tRNA-dihydrouridine synthase
MSKLLDLPKPFFVLAPMDDVTDSVFRRVVQDCAPADLYFTEFVNADGLQSPGRQKLLKKLKFNETEGPLIAQIWGREPENFYKTAKELADGTFAKELGLPEGVNFAGVDLNFGCPQKTEVKNGTCVALINDRPRAGELIDAVREGLGDKLPISVKTRLGFNEVDFSWHEFLLNKKLNMLSIHGRTKKEMSKVPAHWDLIGEVRKLRDELSPTTLIVGNGDVRDRAHGLELAEEYKLDGIMIGRGIFQDPYAFDQKSPFPDFTKEEKIKLYKNHVELFAQTWQHNERPIHTLNKFCKIYINGFDGAKELREKLMASRTSDELLAVLNGELSISIPA